MGFPESRVAAFRAGFVELRHVDVTGSTNADLVAEARAGRSDQVVLVADHQTSGRGRLGRQWIDSGGALLVSFRLAVRTGEADLVVPALAAAARFAAADLTGKEVLFKWPNDLVVESGESTRKLAGFLAEWIDGPEPVVVAGMGLNIEPVDCDQPTASIGEFVPSVSPDLLLSRIIDALSERLNDPILVRREMVTQSATVGRRVIVELPGSGRIVGMAIALDPGGRLVVSGDDGGSHVVSAGDVVHIRPAAPTS